MATQNIQGSPKEQVEQFMELLKDGQLSVEALAQLVPLTQEFMTALFDFFKEVVGSEKEEHAENMKQMQNLLGVLSEVLLKTDLSEEERMRLFDILNNANNSLHDIETTRIKEKHRTIGFAICAIGGVVAFLGLVAMNKNGSTNKVITTI